MSQTMRISAMYFIIDTYINLFIMHAFTISKWSQIQYKIKVNQFDRYWL